MTNAAFKLKQKELGHKLIDVVQELAHVGIKINYDYENVDLEFGVLFDSKQSCTGHGILDNNECTKLPVEPVDENLTLRKATDIVQPVNRNHVSDTTEAPQPLEDEDEAEQIPEEVTPVKTGKVTTKKKQKPIEKVDDEQDQPIEQPSIEDIRIHLIKLNNICSDTDPELAMKVLKAHGQATHLNSVESDRFSPLMKALKAEISKFQ